MVARQAHLASAIATCTFLATLTARTADSQTVVVPDDYPTIQAAIASPATRILVRNGIYAENLTVSRAVSIEPLPFSWDGEYTPTSDAYPKIAGSVALEPLSGSGQLSLVGFHVTGQVHVGHSNNTTIKIAECQVDGGIAGGEPINLSIRGCIVRGGINAKGVYGDITGNTLLGVGIQTGSSYAGCCMAVVDNYVVGPAAIGISFHDGGYRGFISGNTVISCQKGIVVMVARGTMVAENVVMDCTGNGYESVGGNENDQLSLVGNSAQRCGGDGFSMIGIGNLTATGNVAQDCGSYGLRFQNINSPIGRATVTDNRVLRAGVDGILADGRLTLSRNVVGRSHGRGIVVASMAGTTIELDHNTSYWNGLAGFDLSSDVGGTIANNIAYVNVHEGLVWSGAAPTLTCNDWFANVSGATSGVAPGATDLAVDPLFCNVPQDDVHLATFSPLHNAPGCGLVGALDVGCSEPTGVSPPVASRAFSAHPQPAMGVVRFAWAVVSSSGELEVFDATGARRWHTKVAAGSTGLEWRGDLPSGIYFARLSRGGATETARVVIAR